MSGHAWLIWIQYPQTKCSSPYLYNAHHTWKGLKKQDIAQFICSRLDLEDFGPFWKILSVRGVSNWHSHLGIKFLPLLNISQSFTTKHTMQWWIRKKRRSFRIKVNGLMSCLIIRFDIMKATILDSLVSCSLITAICSLISPVVTHKRHPAKTTTKQIVCKLLFTFCNREFVLLMGDVYRFFSKYGSSFT